MTGQLEALQMEIAQLRSEVASLRRQLREEASDTTYHIKNIHGYIVDINKYLWPVIRKVFPSSLS